MVQKFNQKLSKQAGAEEVEVEAPQPENITIDDKPAVEEKPVISLAVEPLKLEVTEEVVVLQVTPREHYKATEPDAKPEVRPTTTAEASPVKQAEPKKEDVKPVETTPTVTVTTPAVQVKPAVTTTTPATTSSPLDQFFQAGESRKEKERIVSVTLAICQGLNLCTGTRAKKSTKPERSARQRAKMGQRARQPRDR